jgi:uncharacterized membrane protein YjjP (DUF1212 family)
MGVTRLLPGHLRDVPFGILLVSGPVGAFALFLFRKRSRRTVLAFRIAYVVVTLGCGVAEMLGRHWIMGGVLFALALFLWFLMREMHRAEAR